MAKNIVKCKNADKYKAIKVPTCGCRACWDKWNARPPVDITRSSGSKSEISVTAPVIVAGGNDIDPVLSAEQMKAKHAALEHLPTRSEEIGPDGIPAFLRRVSPTGATGTFSARDGGETHGA